MYLTNFNLKNTLNSIVKLERHGNVFYADFQLLIGMNVLHVSLKIITPRETMSTDLTQVRFLTRVSQHMSLQVTRLFTLIPTNITLERSFTGVRPHMHLQMHPIGMGGVRVD